MSLTLIIGSTGKTGSETVRLLDAQGVPVRALARNRHKMYPASHVDWVEGSLNDPVSLSAALEGIERVFIAVSLPSEDSVTLHQNLIAAARTARVKQIVKLSAMGTGPRSVMQIGRWHHTIEENIRAAGIPLTSLQPGVFLQNFLGNATSIKAEGFFASAVNDAKVAYIDVRDIARVAVTALTTAGHEGKSYLLTGGQAVNNTDLAAQVSALVGRPIRYVQITYEQQREHLLRAGLPAFYADDLVALSRWLSTGQAAAILPTVRTLTGRDPGRVDQFFNDHRSLFIS